MYQRSEGGAWTASVFVTVRIFFQLAFLTFATRSEPEIARKSA
jgi:hypothetical protein